MTENLIENRVMFSSIGLPGLNGFVGEFLILLGTFETSQTFAVLAALGVILGAVYMLWLYQRLMFGDVTQAETRGLPDLSAREVALMVPIIVLMFWIGVYPNTFLRKMDASSAHLFEQTRVKSKQAACGVRSKECGVRSAEGVVLRAAQALRGGQTP